MPLISMNNVTLKRQGKTLLNNLNWQVSKGEHWAILGLNGSGKTTLLKLIMAEYWSSDGQVEVLGTKFGQGDIPQMRQKIGIVGSFISERLPNHMLAEKIVLTGKYKSSILYKEYGEKELNEARQMLISIGGEHLLGRIYASLSQGEKQLLLITDLPHTPTILYVTHHAEEITDKMNHILLLRRGEIVAQGLKEDIITPQILENFYESPVNIIPIDDKRFFIKPQI